MKIGLDYHGVIDAMPLLFSMLTKVLDITGHEVHIITGHELTEEFRGQLKKRGIVYTHLFSIADFHRNKSTAMWRDEKDTPWMDAVIWNRTKAEYCQQNEIDIHIDDSEEYLKYFTTPYLLMKRPKNETPKN